MKKITILVLISIFLISCNLPTITWNNTPTAAVATTLPTNALLPTAAPTEALATTAPTAAPATQAPLNGTQYNLGGVFMVLPPCLATSATGTLIAAVPYDPNNGPADFYPENRKITFQGYPLSGKFFSVDDPGKLGGLVIYPVADFVAMNQYIADDVTSMQTLLATKPEAPDSIPLLQIVGAAQVFRTQVKYLNFQNGQGVRFLTEYAQYYAPVDNTDLFYAFQGITTDGKYWVSAILPINAAYLQADSVSTIVPAGGILAPAYDDLNLETDFKTYYANMMNKLNTTPDADFTPGLDCLDQYIQSLQIGD
jgi:hypothetical protein